MEPQHEVVDGKGMVKCVLNVIFSIKQPLMGQYDWYADQLFH